MLISFPKSENSTRVDGMLNPLLIHVKYTVVKSDIYIILSL